MIRAMTEIDGGTPGYKRTSLQDNSEGDEEGKQSMVTMLYQDPQCSVFTATLLSKYFDAGNAIVRPR